MPSLVAMTDMIAAVRELADMETSAASTAFVDDTELTARINDGLKQLYTKLAEANGQDYYVLTTTALAFTSGTSLYNLPNDAATGKLFWRLLGVRITDGIRWAQAEPYGWQEEAGLLNRAVSGGVTIGEYRYRLVGTQISFLPTPKTTGHSFVLNYLPAFQPVSGTATFDGIQGWERWAELTAAIDLMNKEEADPSGLLAQRAIIDEQITRMAGQRDAGRPERIQDVRRDGLVPRRPYDWGTTV